MRKIYTQWNYKEPPGEVNTLPSLTQPDMSLSIKQIIARFMITGEIPDDVAQYNLEFDTDDVEIFDVPASSYASDIAELWQDHEVEQLAKQATRANRTKLSDSKSSDSGSAGVTASEQSSETNSSENHSKMED